MRNEFKFELVTFDDSLMTLSNEQSALSCPWHAHKILCKIFIIIDIVVIILEYNTLRKGALGQRDRLGHK